mgnify:CR=1 FL=1
MVALKGALEVSKDLGSKLVCEGLEFSSLLRRICELDLDNANEQIEYSLEQTVYGQSLLLVAAIESMLLSKVANDAGSLHNVHTPLGLNKR